MQTSAAKGTESNTYLFEPEQGNGESFKPVAVVKTDAARPQGVVYHIHTDHLGTPQEVSNAEGQLIWAAQYRAYGALKRQLKVAGSEVHVADQPDRSFTQNLRFMGQYFDEETGLHYNRHRYYDPECGQFTTQDPIGLMGGLNNYQYVPNPVRWVDPLGLVCEVYHFNMVENPGPLASLPGRPAANFAGGKYNQKVLQEDTIYYRGGASGGGKKALGQWFNASPPESVANVRIDNAVKPQWIDPDILELQSSSPVDAVYAIKIPKGTTVYEGPVGYQGGAYLGGQNNIQIYIETPWNINGVQVISENPIK